MTTKEIRGGELKKGRIAKGLTIEECANTAKVSPSTWRKWEYGQTEPDSIDTLLKACSTVGITAQQYINPEAEQKTLTRAEECLLRHYNKLGPQERQAVLFITKRMAAKSNTEDHQ